MGYARGGLPAVPDAALPYDSVGRGYGTPAVAPGIELPRVAPFKPGFSIALCANANVLINVSAVATASVKIFIAVACIAA